MNIPLPQAFFTRLHSLAQTTSVFALSFGDCRLNLYVVEEPKIMPPHGEGQKMRVISTL